MTTRNEVDTVLSGSTGTGSFVGSTSPTLVTPTLGAATATTLTFSPTTGGIVGTTTNDDTNAGNVGEVISSVVLSGSAVSMATNTTKDVTTISLTAGDWDVWSELWINSAASTQITFIGFGINTTSATLISVPTLSASYTQLVGVTYTSGGTGYPVSNTAVCRLSLSGTTTVYLSAKLTFTVSTASTYGKILARRRR